MALNNINFSKKQSKSLLGHANDIIRYMPIDRNTADMVAPFFDFTSAQQKLSEEIVPPQTKRMMRSGLKPNSRSVSETKKKYVASNQSWKCAHCNSQLAASFQVDHIIRLADGGTNHIDNLEVTPGEARTRNLPLVSLLEGGRLIHWATGAICWWCFDYGSILILYLGRF